MYQFRFFMYIWPVLHFWCMLAADQIQTDVGAGNAPIALQTPQPVVTPVSNAAFATEPLRETVSVGNLLAQASPVIQNILPSNQSAQAGNLPPTENPVIQNITPANQSMPLQAPAQIQPQPSVTPAPEEQIKPVVPELPQAPQPITPADLEEKVIEPKGIDTVDLKEPEGNWLFKRIWWEKSKEIFGKIRERVDKIVESRMHFFKERVKLDREILDPFYVEIGLDQGALQESTNNMLELLKKDQEEHGVLSETAQERLAAVQEEKAAITKLGESAKNVRELDQKMDDALEQLMTQINLARAYESEAWQRLDRIAEELNDKKAREDYYAIASLWRNVKEISNYIQGAFAQYFIQLAQASVQNVKNIRSIADLLEKKGIDLKERIELTLAEDEKKAEEEEEEEWPKRVPGWGEWLWNMITAPFSWLASLFS